MPTRWPLFAGLTGTVLILLVALARLTVTAVDTDETERAPNGGVATDEPIFDSPDYPASHDLSESRDERDDARSPTHESSIGDLESMSTPALLVNVALSQGLFGTVLLFGAWYTEVPLSAFGVVLGDAWNVGIQALALGLGFGLVLYVANELLGNVVEDAGIDYSEELREALAPDTPAGWAVLLVVILPAIAGFEEFLFRAALVGALSAGFGVSPWVLAVLSSVAFAAGHGTQGTGGIVVTGLLGFVLAAGFILTGSLLVVIVAHYVVNALEFGVHEGLGLDPL